VAAGALVEADAATAVVALAGRVPVEKADRDQQRDNKEDGAAERLDVEEDGEEHRPRLRPRYCGLGPAD
jgi:hypothetical protein